MFVGVAFTIAIQPCMKNAFLVCAFLSCFSCARGMGPDTFAVYFALKDTTLSQPARNSMDSIIKTIADDSIVLLGYADYRGTAGFNDTISLQRALNVQQYLTAHGIDKKNITVCIGKGKIERPGMTGKTGNAPDRKVLIILSHVKRATSLDKLKVNEAIALHNISFYPGSPEVLPTSLPELDMLYTFMAQNKIVHIQIEGNICCWHAGLHELLSEARARTVYVYLMNRGIEPERMSYIGLGFTHPISYLEETEADRQKNRRVEIRIISK